MAAEIAGNHGAAIAVRRAEHLAVIAKQISTLNGPSITIDASRAGSRRHVTTVRAHRSPCATDARRRSLRGGRPSRHVVSVASQISLTMM
ncbi:MAG: hypothetical protein AAFV86_14220 [Pseudomonadota bacterium]